MKESLNTSVNNTSTTAAVIPTPVIKPAIRPAFPLLDKISHKRTLEKQEPVAGPLRMLSISQTLNGVPGYKTNRYPISFIFSAVGEKYIQEHNVSNEVATAIRCIAGCKTGKFGLNYYECTNCGEGVYLPRSCRNRNCPSCMGDENERWVEINRGYSVDAPYFHIVFTMPEELNDICALNKKFFYDLLMRSAGKTIIKIGQDPKYLGATPGCVGVLHTFGAKLNYHVHAHFCVAGAGLSDDGKHIIKVKGAANELNPDGSVKKQYFAPEAVMQPVFRGIFLRAVKKAKKAGKLTLPEKYRNEYEWKEFIDSLYNKNWVVFCKETFNNNGDALKYLGRYINRVAISNARILRYDDKTVTFTYKDYKDDCKIKSMTVTLEEFVGLFVQHVLPHGFQKVRYFGFLNNRFRKANLEKFRKIQGKAVYIPRFTRETSRNEVLQILYGSDAPHCPYCGSPTLVFKYKEYVGKVDVQYRRKVINSILPSKLPRLMRMVLYGSSHPIREATEDDLYYMMKQAACF